MFDILCITRRDANIHLDKDSTEYINGTNLAPWPILRHR
jgi:hypothetical protein